MPTSLPSLIFDLDGTLTDSKPGILGCLLEVIHNHQLPVPADLNHFIGPPVEAWAEELLPNSSADDRSALVNEYRSCYDRSGWSNNSVFPGVADLIADLGRRGYPLYVCTSKQQHFAERILTHFGLASAFKAIYGDRASFASHAKTDLLALLLREQPVDPAQAWMIGDRSHDQEAAHANHMRCLLVGWGYGSPEERSAADAVAATTTDLIHLLLA